MNNFRNFKKEKLRLGVYFRHELIEKYAHNQLITISGYEPGAPSKTGLTYKSKTSKDKMSNTETTVILGPGVSLSN